MEETKTYRALNDISFSPQVVQYFTQALSQESLAQSYLFAAPPSANALQFARSLARALLCEDGGCGECETCYKISQDIHPDVHLLQPGSAKGYLIEQARDVVKEASQTSVMGKDKFFIVSSAEQLTGAPANALLKTIEEPPEKTHFIFIAPSVDRVLSTIVSRSQTVPFKAPSKAFLKEYVRAKSGASDTNVSMALALFLSPEDALWYLDPERGATLQAARQRVVKTLGELCCISDYELLLVAKELTEAAQTAAEKQNTQKEMLDDVFYTAKQLKDAETVQKRSIQTKTIQAAELIFLLIASFYEDLLKIQAGSIESLANQDIEKELQSYATTLTNTCVLRALNVVGKRREDIRANVSIQLAFEALLLGLKEVVCQR